MRSVAIGLLMAFLAASVQSYFEYRRDLSALDSRLNDIERSYLPSVRENAWLDDRERLGMLAEGIGNLSGIALVQVVAPDGEVVVTSGTAPQHPQTRKYELTHDYSGKPVLLGRLEVTAGLETLRGAALHHMAMTFATNVIVLAGLAALLYWQVHILVTRRLGAIADYARRLGRDGPTATPFADDEAPHDRHLDEFTDLRETLSGMHRDLAGAHDALTASEARYRELFTSSPVPLWEEDFSAVKAAIDQVPPGVDFPAWLDAHPDFIRDCAGLVRIIDVNNAAVLMHRAANRDELLGRLASIFVPSSFDTFRRQLEAIRAGLWDLNAEAQVRTLDGQALDIVLQWHVPPPYRDNLARVIVATEDVSPLKAARRSSEITLERLMETNSEMERFTFVASHDLQEPVRAVVSFTQLLERRLQGTGALTSEIAEFLDYLRAAAQRMQAQVNGLQDYARAGQGDTLAPVDLNDALTDARMQLDPALNAAGATLESEPLPPVRGNRGQLALLFRHLLDNSIKYRRVDVPLRIWVSARPEGTQWRVTVRDNGIGIEPDYAATVFELFRRLHGPGHFPGAGIGLTICRRIVERHGGAIAIDTSVTDGTAIVFTLPASDPTGTLPGA
ncbi:MAG TPA: ATP-binding protein [Magnetospirillum sp.]|nr:ATP-binding protein [Magnetospirillum sp.]